MNVDEAIAYASKDKCFWTGEVHTALETLADEVERLRAEIEMAHSFHRVAVKERDFERLLVEALKEELAAAKAASVVPVGITDLELSESGQRIEFYLEGDKTDGEKMLFWLRDRMKENSI